MREVDLNWLGDLTFWAWVIPVAVAIAFGGFEVGVWWSGRDRAKIIQEREDWEFEQRNAAKLRVRSAGRSPQGHIRLMFINEGKCQATFVSGTLRIGDIERPFGGEDFFLEPHAKRTP